MQGIQQDGGGAQLSVEWQGGEVDLGDPGLERAAAFASVLARTLAAAGYQPRQLSVGVRREPHDVLRLSVRGHVPGISEADFASVARATLNGVSARLGFSRDDELVVVTRLENSISVPPRIIPPRPAEPERKERNWSMYGRVVVGLAFGLLLGVLGLPRLDIQLPALPFATSAGALPTPVAAPAADTLAMHEDPNPPPPTPVLPTVAPTRAPQQTVVPTLIPPRPTPAGVLFAERFVSPLANWPNDPRGTAWFADGEYRLFARDPGRFVATGVPLRQPIRDARLSAQFHKSGGPAGGGYGLVIRDQGATADRDSRNQAGQYLVVEVGDRGDFGVWQRDRTRWIDVVPWTHSDAVHLDRDANALTLTTQGPSLRYEVNGVLVAELSYDKIPVTGGVGIFVGGDLNEVALEWLRIENL